MFMKRRLILAVQWGFCSAHNNKNRFEMSKIIYEYFNKKVSPDVFEGLDVNYSDENVNSNTVLQYNMSPLQEQWQHNSKKLQKTTITEQ